MHAEAHICHEPLRGPARAPRRRGLALAFAAWATVVLTGCAQLSTPTRYTLSESDLQRQVERQFPLEQRVLEVFEVRAVQPRVRLLPERNRLQAVLDVQARERILASRFDGRLDFDAALRWEAADQTVRLDQVRVQDFALLDAPPAGGAVQTAGGAPSLRRSASERMAAALAERMLENLVIYRLPADKQAELAKAGVQPAALAITRSGLEITFSPKAK